MADQVRATITHWFPGTDWSYPSWGLFEGDGFALEFRVGRNEPVDSFGVHVHGSGSPVQPLLQMCAANGWQALDAQTCEFLDPSAPDLTSWREFREWRDRVMKS